jgi:hypothetical protein
MNDLNKIKSILVWSCNFSRKYLVLKRLFLKYKQHRSI